MCVIFEPEITAMSYKGEVTTKRDENKLTLQRIMREKNIHTCIYTLYEMN